MSMVDREELSTRLFVALYTRASNAHGLIADPKADELAIESMAAAQTFAALACRHFGHVYGGEGHTHRHECARCGGDITSLYEADEAEWKTTRQRPGAVFQARRVYIGDCD